MQIRCSGCDSCLPVADKLELLIYYLPRPKEPEDRKALRVYAECLDGAFAQFVQIVKDTGFTLVEEKRQFYVPELEVYILFPNHSYAYGMIRINQPTEVKLLQVQDWLNYYFKNHEEMKYRVKLHLMEFSYDFFFRGGTQDDYASLALRISRSIYPLHAQNTFAVGIVGEEYRCRDKARNGTITLYIQSATRAKKLSSSNKLQRNRKSSQHTKIYEKKQGGIWGLRVEMTPSQTKLKKILKKQHRPFDPHNISQVLKICPYIPFSHFYTFKQCDPVGFSRYIPKMPQAPMAKRIKACLSRRWLEKTAVQPVAEQMRSMGVTRAKYDIHPQKKGRRIKTITFGQACNLPIPEGFNVSMRQGKHTLPPEKWKRLPVDVLAQRAGEVELMPFHAQHENMEQSTPS